VAPVPAQLGALDSLLTWGRLLTALVCLDLRAQLRLQQLTEIYRVIQLPVRAFLVADVITVLTPCSFHIPFLLELSLIEVLLKQVIMTVSNLH